MRMGNKATGGPFAPLVVVVRNIVGDKEFNKLRGKAISLHSQGGSRCCPLCHTTQGSWCQGASACSKPWAFWHAICWFVHIIIVHWLVAEPAGHGLCAWRAVARCVVMCMLPLLVLWMPILQLLLGATGNT